MTSGSRARSPGLWILGMAACRSSVSVSRTSRSWMNMPSRPPMIGPMVVTSRARPPRGPGKATEPKPISSNRMRGPRSRVGFREACEKGASIRMIIPTVVPTMSGKNQPAGALACLDSDRASTTSTSIMVPRISPTKPRQIGNSE
jgi:hypothetical protein